MRDVRAALCVAALLLSASAEAKHIRPAPYRAFPPSHTSLLAQNAEVDRLALPRIKTSSELHELVQAGELVQITATPALRIDRRLPDSRRYCRPWTSDFLTVISWSFFMQFGQPLQVNSAVRTVEVQRSLTRWNRNAAPAHGDTASSHLAGVTVDIARRGLSKAQIAWVEQYLMSLGNQVIVEEEHVQPCWHVCVRGDYGEHFKQGKATVAGR